MTTICTGGGTRTPNQRFWRPLLYQLSYTRSSLQQIYSFRFSVKNMLPGPSAIFLKLNSFFGVDSVFVGNINGLSFVRSFYADQFNLNS